MYLQRLEIQGFKSFARRTVFEFPEKSNHDTKAKSITGIVGPNGSGKSNVADAIRWVLGEQSLKLIRCKKAEEVIFGGSEKKARQGFAEVILYMNNEDKELPIDYSEVAITRRVYRNGENEYLINKSKVRLYDILILLARANFGQRSYGIIGQGMVDHIINISPFERKEFFDEATGVKQYQIKRDQSVNRLSRSRDNLEQTNKILAELEPRLRSLTRQIKKLEKRKEVENGLRELQKTYYAHILQKMKSDRDQYEEKFNIKDGLKQDLQLRLDNVSRLLAESARQESRKDVFNNLQKEYNRITTEKNDLLKDMAVLKGKMSLEYVKVGKQNLSWLENKKEELERRAGEIKESLNNVGNKLLLKKQNQEEAEKMIFDLADQLTVLNNNLQAAEGDLAQIKSGGRANAGYESVKAILRQKDSIQGIHGTVSGLATLDQMYETALSAAAGNRLSAIVVQNDQVAVKCINYLKEHKLGTATFLPLNKIQGFAPRAESKKLLEHTGAIGFAVDLINFDQKFRKIYNFVFGGTIIVDNVQNARDLGVGLERMSTLDGDVFEKSGAMRGGYTRRGSLSWLVDGGEKSLSSQEEKLKEIAILKSKIEDLSRQRQNFTNEINDLRVEIQVSETKQKALSNDLETLGKEKNKIVAEIEENQVAPADQDRYLKNLSSKKVELERQLDELENKAQQMRTKLDQFNLEEEKKKTEVFRLQREMQEHQGKLNEVNNELSDVNIQLARLDAKKEDLDKEIVGELGAGEELEKIQLAQAVNIDQLWFEISKLKHELDQIGGIDAEIVDEHRDVSERYEFLSGQALDLEKAIKDLEKIVDELDEVISRQFNSSFKKINQAFAKYFEKIFQGGKAKLEIVQKEKKETKEQEEVLPEENNGAEVSEGEESLSAEKARPVNTGIEIMVAPPNKKINNIASLSGGERTMTSLALICAIIESNPSPFIVMDEVDAALDEANSDKFAVILQELSYRSQFVIITHNRVVMHVADVLYGVAMGEDGVSKTLSLDLQEAGKLAK